jgi:hypothetical protein
MKILLKSSSEDLTMNGLFDQLSDLINLKILGRGKRAVKMYEVVYYKDEIPKDRGGKTCIITAIPEPNPPSKKKKNGTSASA